MRGVEALPLKYIIIALAAVLAISLLLYYFTTVRTQVGYSVGNISGAVTNASQKIAQRINETI